MCRMLENRRGGQIIGLFFHVYGHNSVNSLHLHIVDLDAVGPSYHKMTYKNCSIDAVLEVLKDDVDGCTIENPNRQVADEHVKLSTLNLDKKEMMRLCPCVNDAVTFREARSSLWQLGGPIALRNTLVREGFLNEGSQKLTVGTKPFNVFARIAFQDSASRNFVSAIVRSSEKVILS